MNETRGTSTSQGPTDQELLQATPGGKTGQEAWVGFFVLVGIVSALLILFWMTDPAELRGRYMLVTTVTDAGGIRVGDPVQMHGVNLGKINDLEMVEAGRVDITMEIYKRWQIPLGSTTEMGSAAIFGGRTLEILPGSSTDYHQPYDTLPTQGVLGGELLAQVDQLSSRAGSVLESISQLLDERTVGSVKGSAVALEDLLGDLSTLTNEQRGALARLTESLTNAAEGLEEASAAGPDIAAAVARADSAMAVLTETGRNLDTATESLRSVLERMDRGEGTLGRLSTDESLYVSLNSAAESLSSLLADLQANPKKYINLSIF